MNVARHDADLDFVGRDDAGTVGAKQERPATLHPVARADHVALRNAFGDADHDIEIGVDRLVDGRWGERRRHVDDPDVCAGRPLGLSRFGVSEPGGRHRRWRDRRPLRRGPSRDRTHGARLERWSATATSVPKSEHHNFRITNPVVEVITNPREMQAPYALCTSGQRRCPDARFHAQKQESLREIIDEGFGCRSRFRPTTARPDLFGLCALRDADVHGYLA